MAEEQEASGDPPSYTQHGHISLGQGGTEAGLYVPNSQDLFRVHIQLDAGNP